MRHGFDEIDGPTFEHLDLYTVKSGEGIVSELFSFRRAGGDTDFALRPEFTPSLARMVAAQARSLPKPIKWFSVGNYFRAEKPQRGRLREFAQWNVDMLGDDTATADAEVIACCVGLLRDLGLTDADVRVRISNRNSIAAMLSACGVNDGDMTTALTLLDARHKLSADEFAKQTRAINLACDRFDAMCSVTWSDLAAEDESSLPGREALLELRGAISRHGDLESWCDLDFGIVRGLAYYTGTVFEVHESGGRERAIAGGGRYDNLVELFGGPPTSAVGFAMGDVVLSLVLRDKGLMKEGAELLESIGARPDAFVISSGDDGAEDALPGVVADLRGGGLHVRHTYRSTRNIGKLLKEADASGARCAVILESADRCVVKDLASGEQTECGVSTLAERLR